MLETIAPAPPDAILGLTEAYKADPNPAKINLGVGIYKDAAGQTPVLASVKAAERRKLDAETSKGYMPIDGAPAYATAVQRLMFGADSPVIAENRAATANTPGGTGALRIVGEYLRTNHPDASIWMSEPTWANHPAIFEAAGIPIKTYPYFDKVTNGLAFDAMLDALRQMPAGDVVLLHGCCHNPTGVDPTPEQWAAIANVLAERGVLPLIDFAYQGFAAGLDEDAAGLRAVMAKCDEVLICSSFSKNFGLYCDRVGALTVVTHNADTTAAVHSQVKAAIRRVYSNPPAHGSAIVATILDDPALTEQWQAELATMRDRINDMRKLFAAKLDERGVQLSPDGNAFITRQNGMFSFSGLSKDRVAKLRDDHSIYIVGSGRINVAGITADNVDTLCDAIAKVM